MRPCALLIDIEGTISPIDFVHKTLFPYAAAHMADFLAAHPHEPALQDVPEPKLATLLDWIARDEKITALKTIQGKIWAAGFAAGALRPEFYPDVAPALRRWAKAGLRLYIYSSGSVEAQKLLVEHAPEENFAALFQGFFDTRVGGKRDSASYAAIARALGLPGAEILFLSDVAAELDAAAAAGFLACQLVRARDGTVACVQHPAAADFAEVAKLFGLPGG